MAAQRRLALIDLKRVAEAAGGEHALALDDLVEDERVARDHNDGRYDDETQQIVHVRVPLEVLVGERIAQAVEGGTRCC